MLQVWPIPTLMPLESKRRQNTINNTDWNVSCYYNSKLPKTYTWSDTFILKDGRYTFTFFKLSRVMSSCTAVWRAFATFQFVCPRERLTDFSYFSFAALSAPYNILLLLPPTSKSVSHWQLHHSCIAVDVS
jgi:hypothetical protein